MTPVASPATPRRGLLLFLGLLVLGSAPLLALIVSSGRPVDTLALYVFPLMWTPALASIATRVLTGEGFGDLSFALRNRRVLRTVGLGVGFPVAVGAIAYGAAWGLGLVAFAAPVGSGWPVAAFGSRLLFAGTVGAAVGTVSAAGEEIGWRGYLIPRLIDAELPAPFVLGGLVWGLWHLPAILTGQYAAGGSRLLSGGLFLALTVSLTALWSTWTIETGSLWPAIVAHAAWNAVIQGPFDAFAGGPLATTLVGESGVFVVATTAVLVVLLVRGRLTAGASALGALAG